MFAGATARTRATLELQTAEELAAVRKAMADAVSTKFRGALYGGAMSNSSPSGTVNRLTSFQTVEWAGAEDVWVTPVGGFAKEPTMAGRLPFQVPMPCVVGSAVKK